MTTNLILKLLFFIDVFLLLSQIVIFGWVISTREKVEKLENKVRAYRYSIEAVTLIANELDAAIAGGEDE